VLGNAAAAAPAGNGAAKPSTATKPDDDPANAGLRREPGLEPHKDIAPDQPKPPANEFEPDSDEPDSDAATNRVLVRNMRLVARQVSMDPGDNMDL
jgi:type IV secretion system protein VirD4